MSGWRSALTSREPPVTDPPRWRRLLPALGYAAGVAVPVTALALLVRTRVDGVLPLDQAVIDAATALARADPGLRGALLAWQEAFQPRWVYLAGTGVAVWVWRRHGLKGRAVWGFVTMMAAWNLALDLKYVVQRARPVVLDAVSHAPGYSFPSGHAANVAAAGTVVTVLLWPVLHRRAARTATVAAAATVMAVTALDRVMLGVHFPTDVAAGLLLGSGLALASYAGYCGWHPALPVHPVHPVHPGPLRQTPKEA